MAALLRVRMETVASWELGRAKPRVRHMAGVIRFIGYDPIGNEDGLPGQVRAARRRLGLTQAEVAATLSLDEKTMLELEHRRRKISRKVREAVGRLLAEANRA
ncbi:MAG: helix-turn-helix transcriptional regulator [Candidatus Eisenbacteria bacterium]